MMRLGRFLFLLAILDQGLSFGQPAESPTGKRELRAAWIATLTNIDWPSRPGLPVADQQRELVHLFDEMQRANMNAVFVQVRPCGDAFFPSRWAPWSAYLTGTQGKDPGYDPLDFMIREAHRHNMQLHAWFNPYRVSVKDQLDQLAPNNPARQHPDWVVKYGGKLFYNPGLPKVKDLLVSSIVEVVKKYEIDGVHFDDYFYPYPVAKQEFPDSATYQQYGSGFKNVGDWRRDNVNRLVSEIAARIRAINPSVQFGISPFGVWRNKAVDPSGSDTTSGLTNYDNLYADTRTWIKNGWIDYVAPQLYWAIGFKPAAYEKLVPWWANEVAGTSVHVYVGQAAYRINASSTGGWENPNEMPNQLILNRRYGAVKGSIFFNLKSLLANRLGFLDRLRTDLYKKPALPPARTARESP